MTPQATGCASIPMDRLRQAMAFELAARLHPQGHQSGRLSVPSGTFAAEEGERLLGKRVLVVEDESMLAMDLGFALEDEGAEVAGPSGTVSEALTLLDAELADIDAAILDVDLHGLDVFPVARRLQEAGVPFLFHTGHATSAELGAVFPDAPVCTKPTLPERLAEEVSHLLR